MTTKEKIILHAVQLFNKEGYGAVNLHELATSMGMSRGNLTYHFPDKESLLLAISDLMWERLTADRAKLVNLPSFANLHHGAKLHFKYQLEYKFIFQDHNVLNHPEILPRFRNLTKEYMREFYAAIAFSMQLGNMKPEPVDGMYKNLSLSIWIVMFSWSFQRPLREEATENGEKVIWSMLIPHFTEKGIGAFKNFFGDEYYESLGAPFDADITNLIEF